MITPSPELIETAARRLIGTPYRDGSMGYEGSNCAGVLCLLFSEVGIHIPFPGGGTETEVAEHPFASHFERIHYAPGIRLALMTVVKMPGLSRDSAHLGTVIAPGMVLHTHRAAGCIVTPQRHLKILEAYWPKALR